MVEVKKTTIWLRKKDAEKPIDGRIKNQGVIMIENKIILIEDDEEIREMINDYLSGEFEVTSFNDGMMAIRGITSYDEYALRFVELRKLKILEELQRMLKNRVLGNLFSMCVYFMLHCTKT